MYFDNPIHEPLVSCFSEEIFYQILIFDFGNFGKIVYDPPLSIRELATLALKKCVEYRDGPIDEKVVENVVQTLTDQSGMLKHYYNLVIEDEMLYSLPLLIGK